MRLPARSLRGQLLAATLALVVVVVALVDVTAYVVLQHHLADRVDRNLQAVVTRTSVESRLLPAGPVPSAAIRQIVPADVYLAMYDSGGRLVLALLPDGLTGDASPVVPTAADLPLDATTVPTRDGSGLRVQATVLPLGESVGVDVTGRTYPVTSLVVGVSLAENADTLQRLLLVQVLAGAAALVLLVLGVRLVLTRGLRPLHEIAAVAREIAHGDPRRRVPVGAPRSDTGLVATALNEAFDARDRGDELTRTFVADASHDLRTPLATIHGWADLYLSGGLGQWEDVDLAMERVRTEATRMTCLVDQLLALARLDARQPLADEDVDLGAICSEIATDAHRTHPDKPVTLAQPDPTLVRGDGLALRRVVSNLVNNAVQHTPTGTSVRLTLHADDQETALTVADNGPGLPDTELERAFDRFWRADPARGPTGEPGHGTGLGLAIARDIARAHNGDLTLTNRATGGLEAHLQLPTRSSVRPTPAAPTP